MKTQSPIITALLAHIAAECNAVDVEARYDAMLDESFSFESVGGPFAFMSPSRVLKEMGPTDYRCGCADWSDSEDWTEIDGDYYEDRDIEAAKQSFLDTLNGELRELEGQLEVGANEEPIDHSSQGDIEDEIKAKQAEIDAVEGYAF